ncbi:MAG: tRNA-guanine transglycosylase, partial [Chloroflexi bacterium]|nr:tRNA-guanine transglycosylase [Chloroflexota bacterium]
GVGDPESFFMVVRRGIDMFDCVLPTRLARHGTLFTRRGRLRLESAAWMADSRPPDSSCDCYTCRSFSRAYLRHLFKAEEALGPHLATVHNVHFCVRLVRDIRSAIIQGRLDEYEQEFLETYQGGVELTD